MKNKQEMIDELEAAGKVDFVGEYYDLSWVGVWDKYKYWING